jgi:hypothetical protein
MQGTEVLVYRTKTFKLDEFDEAIKVGYTILDQMPEYLIRELKGQA